jgi:hypothetical protein
MGSRSDISPVLQRWDHKPQHESSPAGTKERISGLLMTDMSVKPLLMFPRWMLVVSATVFVALITGCTRLADSDVVGTWKFEDKEDARDLMFSEDHSFRSLSSNKEAMTTPEVPEDKGTWRIEGDQVKVEATWLFTQKPHSLTATLDRVHGSLVVTDSDEPKPRPYHRFRMPTCAEARALTPEQLFHDADLIGSWRAHEDTRDDQYFFEANGRYSSRAFFLNDWQALGEGDWHLSDNRIRIRKKKAGSEREKYIEESWLITARGKNCLRVQHPDGCELILERISNEEINLPPSGAYFSAGASPPPTETPSRAR